MAATSLQNNPPSTSTESKSARKKKAKAESGASNGTPADTILPVIPDAPVREDSNLDAKDVGENGHSEHPYIRELNKHLRNVHKKITGLHKTEAIIAENPGVSLDDLVKERKINADQKTSIQKKPQLEAQLAGLEEQVAQYKKIDAEHQLQLQKQREELTAQHEKALEKAREDAQVSGVSSSAAQLRDKLLVFSQFLRCAAAKRMSEDERGLEENRAFEGVLLLVYGGDEQAVQAAMDLIEGKEEKIWSVDGTLLDVTFAQIKAASLAHAPFQVEEEWANQVAEANANGASTESKDLLQTSGTDPTLAYAGLTELETASAHPNGVHGVGGEHPLTSPPNVDVADAGGNAAGDKWDPNAATAEKTLMEDGHEVLPRPQDELELPVIGGGVPPSDGKISWADDHPLQPPTYDSATQPGNQAGENWDTKAAGNAADDTSAAQASVPDSVEAVSAAARAPAPGEDADGFHQVAGRSHRGRGGRGRGFDGNFRGERGGHHRGRGDRGGFRGGDGGEFRGRGRGGFRGRGEGGEFRGRGGGGRGRGPRGAGGAGADGAAREP